MDSWIESELGSVKLGDVRRNRRLLKVAQGMWRSPQASVQGASNGWAEAKAAYRLWESEGSTPQAILAPHYAQSLQRAKLNRTHAPRLFRPFRIPAARRRLALRLGALPGLRPLR